MNGERRSLTPWAILERLERVVAERREARLHWETSFVLVEALRAYVANPKRDEIARIICMRWHSRRQPCAPLCRRCLDLGHALKQKFRGVPDQFGDGDFYDGGHRLHDKR